MKKGFLIALVALGFLVVAAPESEARVFFNIGIGLPLYPYPAYYPAYYGGCGYHPYAYPFSYGYGYGYPSFYYGQRIYFSSGRPFIWRHGHRVFLRRR
jgi:hypothetical protein